MDRIGLRAAGRLAGCNHAHIKRLADAGQIPRGEDGLFDPTDVLKAMAQADPGLVRKSLSKGGDPVVTKPSRSPRGHQSPPSAVTTPTVPLSPCAELVMAVLAALPSTAAWEAAEPGQTTQRSFDAFMNLRLNAIAELRLRGFVVENDSFEPVDWPGLAEEMGLALIDPATMRADWQRRRDAD